MGVVNVTPDSFSDGGAWLGADAAISRGLELAAQGADIIDVGGESTRPGAQRITADEELSRVGPVIAGLTAAGVPVSVDTMRAEVAQVALQEGARLVNDVSGGLADPHMPRLVAAAGVPYVVMHWRGHSHSMQTRAVYRDVVREVCAELRQRVDAVTAAVHRDQVFGEVAIPVGFLQRAGQCLLTGRVQVRVRLVENDEGGIAKNGAGQGNPLLLAPRQGCTTALQNGLIAVRQM